MKRFMTPLVLCFMALNAFSEQSKPLKNALFFGSSRITVPAMANTVGVTGALFQTRVSLLNPTAFSYPIQVSLYGNGGLVQTSTIDMSAGQVRNYENFLQEVFSYSGAGAVRFDSLNVQGGNEANQFFVNTEVYANSAGGQFKTWVPSEFDPITSFDAYSLGINVDSNSRTNIGCFNDSTSGNVIQADLFDSSSAMVSSISLTLSPNSWNQVPVSNNVSGGYIRWRIPAPANCYAVVVHNTSNDGTFIPAAEYTP